jgi:hypothetical protein
MLLHYSHSCCNAKVGGRKSSIANAKVAASSTSLQHVSAPAEAVARLSRRVSNQLNVIFGDFCDDLGALI